MRAVDIGFAQVKLAAIAEVFSDRMKDRRHHAGVDPLLKSAMTRLVRRVTRRQVRPRRTGPKDPQDAVENRARIDPWSTAPLSRRRKLLLRQMRCYGRPLFIGDVHL